ISLVSSPEPVGAFRSGVARAKTIVLPSGESDGSESCPLEVNVVVCPVLFVNWMLPSLTETLCANAGNARAMPKRVFKSRFICLATVCLRRIENLLGRRLRPRVGFLHRSWRRGFHQRARRLLLVLLDQTPHR